MHANTMEKELLTKAVDALVTARETAMMDSGYQLLPHGLSLEQLKDARSALASTNGNEFVLSSMVEVFAEAAEARICTPNTYHATNLEALSDIVGLYLEYDDYTC